MPATATSSTSASNIADCLTRAEHPPALHTSLLACRDQHDFLSFNISLIGIHVVRLPRLHQRVPQPEASSCTSASKLHCSFVPSLQLSSFHTPPPPQTAFHVLNEHPPAACSFSTSSVLTKTDIPFLGHQHAVRQPAHQRPPPRPTTHALPNQQRHLLFATNGITRPSASYFLSPTALLFATT